MRELSTTLLLVITLVVLLVHGSAKKPSRPRSAASSSGRRPPSSTGSRRPKEPPVTRRRAIVEDDVYDEEGELEDVTLGIIEEEDVYDEEEEEKSRGPPRSSSSTRRTSSSRTARDAALHRSKKRPPPRYEEDDFEEDYRPRARSAGGGDPRRKPPAGGRGRVVPYTKTPAGPSTFTRGLDIIRSSMPDPNSVKNAAFSTLKTAREATSGLSSNLYREIKGLTSSELEQVMLKATRPDDTAVKGKHVERLVGVTYQISARYDIYDAVLRKLWSKMAEKDWRTTIKALYILHRFSADGAPDHAPALKARLRELRRTRDPKRKDKYFNSKQLLAGDSSPENIKFRAFMSRYAHYVLLRTQCFGGMFDEISSQPKADKKKAPKPITSTSLRAEHLEAAKMLLKAGIACQLKDGEECENTAIAAERVASDLIGLTTAVAVALNRALKDDDLKGSDPALLKKWCEFYKDDLQPQTRTMVKKTSPKLDAYGLFLPSRMGTSVSKELLDKGMSLDTSASATTSVATEEASADEGSPAGAVEEEEKGKDEEAGGSEPESAAPEEEAVEEEAEFDDEYEYDEEEYYDEEE